MNVGIYTRWQRHDTAYAAISAAEFMAREGHNCTIYPREWTVRRVDARWDAKVLSEKVDFVEWYSGLDVLIWTELPSLDDYILMLHIPRVRNILYTSWDAIRYDSDEIVSSMYRICLPTFKQCNTFAEKWSHPRITAIPYTPWLPPTIKTRDYSSNRVNIFVSLFGLQLRRVDVEVIVRLARAVETYSNLSVVIGSARGLRRRVRHRFGMASRALAPRFTLLADTTWHEQLLWMGYSDLTIWLPKVDGFGVVPRSSLAMGTPVLGMDVHPSNEYISSSATCATSGFLLPTTSEPNWFGMPVAQPDFDAYSNLLTRIANEPQMLDEPLLGASAATSAVHRAAISSWREVLA